MTTLKNFAKAFDFTPPDVQSNPRAMIIIKKNETYYGVSFGSAYHYIEPLSDKEWAFNYIKRLKYNKINLMATTIPQSKLNKQISSYINFNETEINVGESLNKITAYMEPNNELKYVTERIQAGNSLKFKLEKDNLETIAKTISYVENVIATEEIHWEIPHMIEVKNEEKLKKLNDKLKKEIKKSCEDNTSNEYIDINNYIYYSNEIKLLDDFTEFKLKYKKKNTNEKFKEKEYSELNLMTIIDFINLNTIDINEILNISVIMANENEKIIRELDKIIIYDCVDENCIYEYGKWNEFNQDYISQIEKEISTIPAKYCPKYSFETEQYKKYINEKIQCRQVDFFILTLCF